MKKKERDFFREAWRLAWQKFSQGEPSAAQIQIIQELALSVGADIFGGATKPWSYGESRAALTLAARRLAERANDQSQQAAEWPRLWQELAEAGHRGGKDDWQASARALLAQEPELAQPDPPEPPSIAKQMWPYIWSAVQATIVMKIVILYYGQHAALYPEQNYGWLLALAIAFSFGSLFYFAWRRERHEEEEGVEKGGASEGDNLGS